MYRIRRCLRQYFAHPITLPAPFDHECDRASRMWRAKPLSAANGVGRSPLLAQNTHARKRSFLNWQSADDTATRHDFYSTTPGKAQQPEYPLTFTSLCRQGRTWASRLRLQHSPPQSQGHAQERTSCADQPPFASPAVFTCLHHTRRTRLRVSTPPESRSGRRLPGKAP